MLIILHSNVEDDLDLDDFVEMIGGIFDLATCRGCWKLKFLWVTGTNILYYLLKLQTF